MNTSTSTCCTCGSPETVEKVAVQRQCADGAISYLSPQWSWRDWLGAFAVRWCFQRNIYTVPPGLYSINGPTPDSPLLVTANYKLSLDHLRRELEGVSAWIVVLDTQGINVWCAAGKGTFGTIELVQRLESTNVAQRLTHRTVVLPQLGAPGIAAHEVTRQTGFKVVYGPVYARDLPAFLNAGMKATPQMRRIRFSLGERLAVAPVELVQRLIPALCVLALFLLLSGVTPAGYHVNIEQWPWFSGVVASHYLMGNLFIPLLLPWLPGCSFALKGATAGFLLGCGLCRILPFGWLECLALGILGVAACSYMGLMFTGCTPYTSPSGVRKELKWTVPLQILLAVIGVMGWLASRLI